MKFCWLLPDTNQSGEIGIISTSGYTSLKKSLGISLNDLPDCIVLGMPESVARENPSDNFIFAQYAKLSNNQDVFLCSIRAGKDVSGRTVFLTYIQLIKRGEIEKPSIKLITEGVDGSVIFYMQKMSENLTAQLNLTESNIKSMIEGVKETRLRTFASENPYQALSKPEWLPKKKTYLSKIAIVALLTILLLLMIFLA